MVEGTKRPGIYIFTLLLLALPNPGFAQVGQNMPNTSMAIIIEEAISRTKCSKLPYHSWLKEYSFKSWTSGTVYHRDYDFIKFYMRPSRNNNSIGERIFLEDESRIIDDGDYKYIYGYYHMSGKKITHIECGENLSK